MHGIVVEPCGRLSASRCSRSNCHWRQVAFDSVYLRWRNAGRRRSWWDVYGTGHRSLPAATAPRCNDSHAEHHATLHLVFCQFSINNFVSAAFFPFNVWLVVSIFCHLCWSTTLIWFHNYAHLFPPLWLYRFAYHTREPRHAARWWKSVGETIEKFSIKFMLQPPPTTTAATAGAAFGAAELLCILTKVYKRGARVKRFSFKLQLQSNHNQSLHLRCIL